MGCVLSILFTISSIQLSFFEPFTLLLMLQKTLGVLFIWYYKTYGSLSDLLLSIWMTEKNWIWNAGDLLGLWSDTDYFYSALLLAKFHCLSTKALWCLGSLISGINVFHLVNSKLCLLWHEINYFKHSLNAAYIWNSAWVVSLNSESTMLEPSGVVSLIVSHFLRKNKIKGGSACTWWNNLQHILDFWSCCWYVLCHRWKMRHPALKQSVSRMHLFGMF